ncbi:SDR family NAD(P)-dependent oxidoreductase [Rhodococcus sp. NPDC057529]|uniref:SDR family NAD(P)-dependent oxidoreductase n=1 Tax=Rhodococcus sp. NPDC057529 TaxID=3346158 RepID=UPI00366FEA8E
MSAVKPHERAELESDMGQVLQGKVALVTGGSAGIGKAIASRFVAEGAEVVITGRRQTELDVAVAELGIGASGIRADVSKVDDLDSVYDHIRTDHGALDIVVANAGGGVGTVALGEITQEQYATVFDTNVKGVVFTVQKALPLFRESASIILIGSTASLSPGTGMTLYASSKAAVRNLARCWTIDLQGTGTRVNVLSPGATLTPGLLTINPNDEEGLLDGLKSIVPLGRIADPDEIAKVALFLASDASSYVQGAELFADGGLAQV